MTVHIPEQTSAAAWKLIAEKRDAEKAKLREALKYARNLIGPDEIIDAALKD